MKNKLRNMLIMTLFLIGGISMTNAQEKPPLLGNPPNIGYGQVSPSQGQVAPPPPGQVAPPPPSPQVPPQPPMANAINRVPVSNASIAVATAKKAKEYLTAGKIWTMTGPRGETEVKAAILYEGTAVAVLHFNPTDGTLLPLGVHPAMIATAAQIENIRSNLPTIIRSLEVLNGAEYREPESAWIVPLAYNGMIVAHLKIYVDGIHIMPDYPANQEMQLYGR